MSGLRWTSVKFVIRINCKCIEVTTLCCVHGLFCHRLNFELYLGCNYCITLLKTCAVFSCYLQLPMYSIFYSSFKTHRLAKMAVASNYMQMKKVASYPISYVHTCKPIVRSKYDFATNIFTRQVVQFREFWRRHITSALGRREIRTSPCGF